MADASEIPEVEQWEHWRSQTVAERHAFFLEHAGYLKSPAVIEAFHQIDRADFLRPQDVIRSMNDMPIPIGHEQTNSQPSLVASMLELLKVEEGQKVLDIGAGSGWTTALLGQLAGERGTVIGMERIPELADMAKVNLAKYRQLAGVRIRQSGDLEACTQDGPFDRILVSASTQGFPEKLTHQLAENGRMIIPVRDALVFAHRRNGTVETKNVIKGISFVPLITP